MSKDSNQHSEPSNVALLRVALKIADWHPDEELNEQARHEANTYLTRLEEQLEAAQTALRGIILCSTISHAWTVASEALGEEQNPAKEPE